jgi:hypothetical protein
MVGEARESLQVREEHADLALFAAQLGGARVATEPVRERRRNVRAVETVDVPELRGRALEQGDLVSG